MKSLFFIMVSLGLCVLFGIIAIGVVAVIVNPEAYQDHVEKANDRRRQAKLNAEYLRHFEISRDEKLEYRRIIENAVQQHYQNEAIVGVILFERIDKKPNGDLVRYVVNKQIKVPGKIRKRRANLRAMIVVEYKKGGSRKVEIQFIDVDGVTMN